MKETPKHKGRGIHNPKLIESLKGKKLKDLLNAVSTTKKLDVQLRNDYIDIYYKGGRIAAIKSERSARFDEKYFQRKDQPASREQLEERRRALLQKFQKGRYNDYFGEAASVMDWWFKDNPNPERSLQHDLSMANRGGDFAIIDIEYQVSRHSNFALQNSAGYKAMPRFDIVAVNRHGQLCVIELKKGVGSLVGKTGLAEHLKDYNHSIGRAPADFVKEMQLVLTQKQELELIDHSVVIREPEPVFMYAFYYNSKVQYEQFMEVYNQIESPRPPCLFLRSGELKLSLQPSFPPETATP